MDVHGFAFVEIPPGDSLRDNDAIEKEYLLLMESLLKEHLKAKRVVCFDYAASLYPTKLPPNARSLIWNWRISCGRSGRI